MCLLSGDHKTLYTIVFNHIKKVVMLYMLSFEAVTQQYTCTVIRDNFYPNCQISLRVIAQNNS